ncbi:hypothetical protein [Clostridium tertium]|jgi:hypothetical protein|uniref:hypothetical protein n=1 Tax=Clostridium tertium TaxID=1559 RepID=UPI00159640A9|nr:hypothetical protein [Clostridium tertium]
MGLQLTDKDINQLRNAYQNDSVSIGYLAQDVKSIMMNIGCNKDNAIESIVNFLGKVK